MRPGLLEIVLLIVVLVLIFGARRLPEIGRGLGGGLKAFKHGVTGRDELPRDPSA